MQISEIFTKTQKYDGSGHKRAWDEVWCLGTQHRILYVQYVYYSKQKSPIRTDEPQDLGSSADFPGLQFSPPAP